MRAKLSLIDRFFQVLVEQIREVSPEYLRNPFTVAEIYQSLVPYRTHRDRIGAEINGDYEDALLRLLAGEGGYLTLESETARERIRLELRSSNPNTGLYREYAAVGVTLNRDMIPEAAAGDADADELDLDDLLAGTRAPALPERERSDDDDDETSRPSAGADAGSGGGPGTETVTPTPKAGPAGPDAPAAGTRAADPTELPDRCPECRTDLPTRDTLRFCPQCGTNVFVAPCGSCGEVLERSWRFCIACGSEAV